MTALLSEASYSDLNTLLREFASTLSSVRALERSLRQHGIDDSAKLVAKALEDIGEAASLVTGHKEEIMPSDSKAIIASMYKKQEAIELDGYEVARQVASALHGSVVKNDDINDPELFSPGKVTKDYHTSDMDYEPVEIYKIPFKYKTKAGPDSFVAAIVNWGSQISVGLYDADTISGTTVANKIDAEHTFENAKEILDWIKNLVFFTY